MAQIDTGPTLTNITAVGRQVVKYGAIILVAMIVGRTLLNAFASYWRATHPPAPPPPTMGFNSLPPIKFPSQTSDDKPTTYRLETSNGRLPGFGDRAKVYLMPKTTLSLLADQKVRGIASKYGYLFAPQIINTSLYRWTKSVPLEATLEIDSQTFGMKLTTDYKSRPQLLSATTLPDGFDSATRVKAFLSTAALLNNDVATAEAKVAYLKLIGNQLQPAASYSDADFVQVDLNRAKIDGIYDFYTAHGDEGIIHAIVAGGVSGNDSIVELNYRYFTVDYSQFHTYPLRTTESAWRLLQSGEGYVASKGEDETAIIREVTMGYFESDTEQPFLQPVYVFLGDDGFMGYVPALDSRVYISPTTP